MGFQMPKLHPSHMILQHGNETSCDNLGSSLTGGQGTEVSRSDSFVVNIANSVSNDKGGQGL